MLEDEQEIVSHTLVAEKARKSPAELLGIYDELTAYEFNAACWYAWQNWHDERESQKVLLQIKSFAVVMGADPKKVFANDGQTDDFESEFEADIVAT